MGPSKSILLVDSDNRSLRVLEVSLKKAGFQVQTAQTAAAALQSALSSPPDLVVTDTQLPDYDGFELARRLKAEATTAETALIFLSQDSSAEAKISAINAGSEFYLTKPVLVRDILSRINELVERQQTETAISQTDRPGNLSGTLANMGVVDLIQLMESGNRSGIIHLSTDRRRSGGFVSDAQNRGTLFFRDGQVVDARFAQLVGLEAVYRMLLWEDGVFELEFKAVTRDDVIQSSTQTILLEGMRRVDEWSKFAEKVPPISTRLAIDYGALTRAFPQVAEPMQAVLHLFDGRRTLLEVIDDAPMTDVEALQIISDLHAQGVLYASDRPSSTVGVRQPDVEAWLAGGPSSGPGSNGSDGIPSVLGDAVIPSPRSPSEILGFGDPRAPGSPMPQPQVLPAGDSSPARRSPSITLARHTVRASQSVVAGTSDVSAPTSSADLQRPRLTVKRVSSVLEAPPVPMGAPQPSTQVQAQSPLASPFTPTASPPTPGRTDVWPGTTTPPVGSTDEEATVTDMPAPGLSRPAWDQARAMVNEPTARGTSRPEGFVRAPVPPTTAAAPSASYDLPRYQATQSAVPAPAAPVYPQGPVAAQAPTGSPAPQTPLPQAPAVPGTRVPLSVTGGPPAPAQAELLPSAAPSGAPSLQAAQPTAPADMGSPAGGPTGPAGWQSAAPQESSSLSDTVPGGGWPTAQAAPTEPSQTLAPLAPADTVPSGSPDTVPVRDPAGQALPPVSGPADDDASRDFFATEAKSEVDIDWDHEGPAWKRRLPGLLLGMSLVVVVLVLALGGRKQSGETAEATAEANNAAPAAELAETPESGIMVQGDSNQEAKAGPAGPAENAPAPENAPADEDVKPGAPATEATPASAVGEAPKADVPEKAEPEGPSPQKIAGWVKAGNRAILREKITRARYLFGRALKADPDNASAHAGMAMVWVNLSKDSSAQAAAWRAIKTDRAQPQAHLALALVYSNKGDFDKAKRYYKSFLKYEPSGKRADEVRRVLSNLP